LTGAHVLAEKHNIPTTGIPATIDNDVTGVDLTLGADTAVNVALDALDKIRDTATSLERIFVVEVMGRRCGYIALQIALAGGCEEVLVPEMDYDFNTMYEEIKKGNAKGKISWIIIVAEGKTKADSVADKITDKTGFETRVTVLGHIQRGGRPTAKDRILGARLGHHAVKKLNEGLTDRCVAVKNNEMTTLPLNKAILPKKTDPRPFYSLIKLLT
jgi:6-phosphofructokinase 1